jgi:membrane-bound lytic murein transglycosylase D
MTKTAQRFGLRVDKWVDERRDPEKSTRAAADYLKNLHQMFNCWYLAAAGYNAGEGKILEAMRRANSSDYWEISQQRYLKQETKEYVPMMLAAMIIAQDPPRFGFSNVVYQPPLTYERVVAPPGTRLDRIARAAETDLGKIQALNPSLRRDKTPPYVFEIKVPPGKRKVFEANFYKKINSEPPNREKYKVRRGDTLAKIAQKYRVNLKELCDKNHLSLNSSIRPGSTLLLPR